MTTANAVKEIIHLIHQKMKKSEISIFEWSLSDFTLVAISQKGCVIARENTTGNIVLITRRVMNSLIKGIVVGTLIETDRRGGPEQKSFYTLQRLSSF